MPTKIKQSMPIGRQVKSQKIPKLRFAGFSGEWEEKRLREISSFRRGSFPQPYGLRKWYDDKNGFPFVQVCDVGKNFNLKSDTKRKITNEAKKLSVLVKKGTIVLTIQGSIGRIAITQYDACVDRTLLIFQSFNQPMNKVFFMHLIFLLFEIEKLKAPGGTIKTITKESLGNFKILFPLIAEQQKIAEFLGFVDEWIENFRAQKENLESYKKGMTQKIFSQEIRFKDNKGNNFPKWEEKRLGEIAKLITKGTTPTSVGYKFISKGINFIKVENISQNGFLDISLTLKISIECDKVLSRSRIKNGDILFSIAGTLGRTVIITKKDLPANTNQALAIIRLKKEDDINFVNYFLNLEKIKKYIKRTLSVGAQPNLNLQQIGDIKILLPSFPEQQKIADFLTSIDNLINSKQQQITQAESWKKGLMQGLLV